MLMTNSASISSISEPPAAMIVSPASCPALVTLVSEISAAVSGESEA